MLAITYNPRERKQKANRASDYSNIFILLLYDITKDISKTKTKSVKNVVIGGDESYDSIDNMTIMILHDKYEIFYIWNHFNFDFLDIQKQETKLEAGVDRSENQAKTSTPVIAVTLDISVKCYQRDVCENFLYYGCFNIINSSNNNNDNN